MEKSNMISKLNQLANGKLADSFLSLIGSHYEKTKLLYDVIKNYDTTLVNLSDIYLIDDQTISITISISNKEIKNKLLSDIRSLESEWFIIEIEENHNNIVINVKNNGIIKEVDIYADKSF